MGSCYEHREGVEQSFTQALYYYKKSAEQLNPLGLYCLAECYANGSGVEKSQEQALYYYRLAADHGHLLSQFVISDHLLKSEFDKELAVKYLKLIIQTGDFKNNLIIPSTQYKLATCYEKGIGINKSIPNALYYYKLAAENGYDCAQDRLGDAYAYGELGLERDLEKAVQYYKLAEKSGYNIK